MEQIVSISTVCVTFVLGILGFVLNSLVQRKSNSIKVITQHRLDRRQETQRIAAIIIKYSDPKMISLLDTKEEKEKAIKEIIEKISKLRAMYFRSYECDIRLLDKADALKTQLIRCIEGAPVDEYYLSCRDAFIKEVDIYVTTEWKRIKLETIGKSKIGVSSLGTWEDDYDYTLNSYNKYNKGPEE